MDSITGYIWEQIMQFGPFVALLALGAWDLRNQLIACQKSSANMVQQFIEHLKADGDKR